LFVFVDESAEDVAAIDGGCRGRVAVLTWVAAVWWGELERAVGTVLVVVLCVEPQDALEMSASKDEDAIEAVAANGTHPAPGVGVCLRRFHGRPD
jgi:hypothetical protein